MFTFTLSLFALFTAIFIYFILLLNNLKKEKVDFILIWAQKYTYKQENIIVHCSDYTLTK